jgi:F420-non-reducing hydrogenase large subunit
MVYCCERAEELLNDPEITSREIRAKNIEPKAGEGVGCVEAPRGTLIHHYKTDENGSLRVSQRAISSSTLVTMYNGPHFSNQ